MSVTDLDRTLGAGAEAAEVVVEPYSAELALGAPEPLASFNRLGILSAADIRVALTLGSLAGVGAEAHGGGDAHGGGELLLAAALAVRAPRLGHVFVDLAAARQTVAVDVDEAAVAALPWPDPAAWRAALAACPGLVSLGEPSDATDPTGSGASPLRLVGGRLYLERYWREERELAAALRALALAPPQAVELAPLAARLRVLFPADGEDLPRAAAATAALRGLTVIAGGPGTGKTTTVARICALLLSGAGGAPPPLIALCAPTGKAAARLQEAVRDEAARVDVSEPVRAELRALRASTIHRLLGWRPRTRSRFRHDVTNRLPHDVVIVDETSMVPLMLMGRLLEAVRPDARLVLVGDPDQLTAVEAGAVLRDIVGPASAASQIGPRARALLERVAAPGPAARPPGAAGPATIGPSFGDGIIVLRRGFRFGQAIGQLADAVRRGDADGAVEAARAGGSEITWLELDPAHPRAGAEAASEALAPLREAAVEAGAAVIGAATAGDARRALNALAGFRLLCAHRHGPYGVAVWSAAVERWLAGSVEGFSPGDGDYPGRPLLIVRNDYELQLYNGDTGVVMIGPDGRLTAAFERDGRLTAIAPSRLEAVETVHAMTVHKSQGSQFGTVAALLPAPESRLLSRELLYTAITRAQRMLILAGTEESLRVGIERPVARATGLRERLWEEPAAGAH